MYRTLACATIAVAVLAAGCGGDDDDGAALATATTPAAAKTPPAQTTAAQTSDDPNRGPVTVRGKLGDPLTLEGQRDPEGREKVRVTVERVRGPFSGYDLASGRELIGVQVRIANLGRLVFDDPQPGGTLTLVGGETGKQTNLITVGKKSPCDNPSLKLTEGQSKQVCIAYEVPKSAKLQAFEFAVDSGYGDKGVWRVGEGLTASQSGESADTEASTGSP